MGETRKKDVRQTEITTDNNDRAFWWSEMIEPTGEVSKWLKH